MRSEAEIREKLKTYNAFNKENPPLNAASTHIREATDTGGKISVCSYWKIKRIKIGGMVMSWDVQLADENGKKFSIEPLREGGTQQLGGNTETWLNITYNYSWYYYLFLNREQGLKWLHGKKAKDVKDQLVVAIEPFENEKPYSTDYWADTPGNCVRPLKVLLEWAIKFPEGIFEVN